MRAACWVVIVAVIAVATATGSAVATEREARWSVDAALGTAHNFHTPLTIAQNGEPELRIHAHWESRAFEPPLYYSARIARWTGDRAWALELVHHKIRLVNAPPEVQAFEVSHGYNLVALLRMRESRAAFVGAGAGVIVGHPESTVRDLPLPERGMFGYHVTGPLATVLAGVRWRITPRWSAHVEGKLSAAHASLPVALGSSRVPNVAAHVLAGVRLIR